MTIEHALGVGHDGLLKDLERSAVERVIADKVGQGVSLEFVDQVRRGDDRVLRVASSDDSWIVKRAGGRTEEALYGPRGFFAEWVGAATVVATGVNVSPDFLGGDRGETLMVFDDVGRGPDVSQLLRSDDRSAAEEALVAMGRALGRMHMATEGAEVEAAYSELWRDLCGGRPLPRTSPPRETLAESLSDALAGAGVGAVFDGADLAELQAWALDGEHGCALIHGDPCLDNWIIDSDQIPTLIDFQAARFAPVALDAAYARAPFPTCWCLRRLPGDVVDRFEGAHRAALAEAGSGLADPTVYRRQIAFATAWWFIVQVLWGMARTGAEGASAPSEYLGFRLVPQRDSILLRLDSFLDVSARSGALPSLADQAALLRDELAARWGEPSVDLYPAFGGGPA